ncbi:hypothetical protein D3C87_1759930 [compost metagenome]
MHAMSFQQLDIFDNRTGCITDTDKMTSPCTSSKCLQYPWIYFTGEWADIANFNVLEHSNFGYCGCQDIVMLHTAVQSNIVTNYLTDLYYIGTSFDWRL